MIEWTMDFVLVCVFSMIPPVSAGKRMWRSWWFRRPWAPVRVWCIGPDETEFFAAHDEQELRRMYVEMVGAEQMDEDFSAHCEEVPQDRLDDEFDWNDDGNIVKTTWRKQLAGLSGPCQVSTSYN